MYNVILWDQYCSTVPNKWVNMRENLCVFPPGEINLVQAVRTGLNPESNWIRYKFKKVLGPYPSFETAATVERTCIEISSTNDIKLNALSRSEMNNLPAKRLIKKRKFYDDDFVCDVSNPGSESDTDISKATNSIKKAELSSSLLPTNNKQRRKTKELGKLEQTKNINMRDAKHLTRIVSKFPMFRNTSEASVKASNIVHRTLDDDIQNGFKKSDVLSLPIHNKRQCSQIRESVDLEMEDKISIKEENSVWDINDRLEASISCSPLSLTQGFEENENSSGLNENIKENGNVHTAFSASESYVTDDLKVKVDRLYQEFTLFRTEVRKKLDQQNKILKEMIGFVRDNDARKDTEGVDMSMDFLLPDFPLQGIDDYLRFESQLQTDKDVRKLFAYKIKRLGGDTIQKVVSNILKFAITLELGHKLTWTGCNGSTKIEGSTFANIIVGSVFHQPELGHTATIACVVKHMKSWLQHAGDKLRYRMKKLDKTN
ncbi:uncharacterized protein [Prorops nasuta]|uniref:uncharacterized protein n=1 Tax=Prorops nasuta TaxID=863751 RepID=UPI0034CE500F